MIDTSAADFWRISQMYHQCEDDDERLTFLEGTLVPFAAGPRTQRSRQRIEDLYHKEMAKINKCA